MCELFQQERCSREECRCSLGRYEGLQTFPLRDLPLELSRDETLKHDFGQVQAIDDLPCSSIINDVSSDAACSC